MRCFAPFTLNKFKIMFFSGGRGKVYYKNILGNYLKLVALNIIINPDLHRHV